MSTVAINPPKTPVTKGSSGIAAATLPNVALTLALMMPRKQFL